MDLYDLTKIATHDVQGPSTSSMNNISIEIRKSIQAFIYLFRLYNILHNITNHNLKVIHIRYTVSKSLLSIV